MSRHPGGDRHNEPGTSATATSHSNRNGFLYRIKSNLLDRIKQLKRHALTVYFAARDPRMSFALRVLAVAIAAYAFSPIDLIPDFIPVLGLLDDLIIIPLGLALVIRLAPEAVIKSARERATAASGKPTSYLAGVLVVGCWLVISFLALRWTVLAYR